MKEYMPSSLPSVHREFLRHAVRIFESDVRIAGLAAGGSYLTDTMDAFSDLDLIVVTEADRHDDVMADRKRMAGVLGPLLEAFTGEHVGEPRLLICLYGPPLLHVDLKFVAVTDLAARVEEPTVLWERDGRLKMAVREGKAYYPAPDASWIEERFRIWLHYAAGKIGRGELFEAMDFISYLRGRVLGPLGLQAAGARPNGVRKIESLAPEFAQRLQQTVAAYDARDCVRALRVCVEMYRSLRTVDAEINQAAEVAAMQYLDEVERALK